MSHIKNIFRKFKKPALFVPVIILIVLIVGISYFLNTTTAVSYTTSEVKTGTVVQEVSVTGMVKPDKAVDLAFEKSGKIARINVEVGDNVFTGQTLASLANGDIYSQYEQAVAIAKMQEAKLNELQKGTRPEQIILQETKVTNAESALNEAKKDLIAQIQDAYTKSDDAIRNKTDIFFSNPRTTNPKLVFNPTDTQLQLNVESKRVFVEEMLKSWFLSIQVISSNDDLSSVIKITKDNLSTVKDFLGELALAVNNLGSSYSTSQTTIDSWKSNMATARTNVSTAIDSFTASESQYTTANSSLSVEKQQLAIYKAGSTPEQIKAQEASFEEAQAGVRNAEAQLNKTIITAPFSGVITNKSFEVGEIVPANSKVLSLISQNKYKIEADITEIDIARVKIGDIARVTLDAYGSDILFEAKVSFIDPAETIIDGVATYKTTLYFTKEDEKIKSGMTANIDISTAKKDNVLFVPQRSVYNKGSDKYVKVFKDGQVEERKIMAGLKGSDGSIEIMGGLSEGEQVIISSK